MPRRGLLLHSSSPSFAEACVFRPFNLPFFPLDQSFPPLSALSSLVPLTVRLPLRIPILLRLVHSHETRNERRGTPLFRSRNNSSSLRFQSIQEINDLNFVENLSRILSRTRKKKELHKPGDGILENKRRNNRRGEEDGREVTCSTLSIHSRKGKYRDPVIRDKAAKRC